MTLRAAWLAVAALVGAALAGCGGHASATRLSIEVQDRNGARAFRVECDPTGGGAPHPEAICAELRREPKLLVGGRGINGPCPAADDYEVFRVSGTYRRYAIDATFGGCSWVPGQHDAALLWSHLMADAGPGRAERELGKPRLTRAERERRRVTPQRLRAIRQHDARLKRARQARLEAGLLRVGLGRRPDAAALQVLRDYVIGNNLVLGLRLAAAEVYSTSRKRVERVMGYGTTAPNAPVYLLVVHYAYLDYKGHVHRDPARSWSLVDARTLGSEGGGLAGNWPRRRFGRATVLPL